MWTINAIGNQGFKVATRDVWRKDDINRVVNEFKVFYKTDNIEVIDNSKPTEE